MSDWQWRSAPKTTGNHIRAHVASAGGPQCWGRSDSCRKLPQLIPKLNPLHVQCMIAWWTKQFYQLELQAVEHSIKPNTSFNDDARHKVTPIANIQISSFQPAWYEVQRLTATLSLIHKVDSGNDLKLTTVVIQHNCKLSLSPYPNLPLQPFQKITKLRLAKTGGKGTWRSPCFKKNITTSSRMKSQDFLKPFRVAHMH